MSDVVKKINKRLGLLNEGNEVMYGFDRFLDGEDEVGAFWVVTKPKLYWKNRHDKSKGHNPDHQSTLGDICFPSTILGMVNQVRGGLNDKGQIYGFYKSEKTAKGIAERLLKSAKDGNDAHLYYED